MEAGARSPELGATPSRGCRREREEGRTSAAAAPARVPARSRAPLGWQLGGPLGPRSPRTTLLIAWAPPVILPLGLFTSFPFFIHCDRSYLIFVRPPDSLVSSVVLAARIRVALGRNLPALLAGLFRRC